MSKPVRKCQAKGGVANCTNPRCPEKMNDLGDISLPSEFKTLQQLSKPDLPIRAWSEKDTVLFKTIHGSKLYGLAHANSDDDYYVVTPTTRTKKQLNAKHRINGDRDTVTVDFNAFTRMAQMGVPQALEAMFSRKAVSPFFEAYRTKWFASDPAVVDRYLRTIKRFSLDDSEKQLKYRRHALRLSLNLDELVHTGRFNPTLSKSDVRLVKRLADLPDDKYLKELNQVNPFDLNWTYEGYKEE